jgi:hypothetical protein
VGTIPPSNRQLLERSVECPSDGSPSSLRLAQKHKVSAYGAVYHAISQWHFNPYMKDGKPEYFHADIIFQIH